MNPAPPRVEPFGDAALLVTFGQAIDPRTNERARVAAVGIENLRGDDPRFGRAVVGYASVLVPFDPVAIAIEEAAALVSRFAEAASKDGGRVGRSEGRLVEIPVRYGGDDGPDLDSVAELHGLRPEDVVEIHAGTEYHAFFLGFAPGFAYLGSVPEAIASPRLATPRQRVPAGSVGIADSQTGVYPFALPGGWRLIGRTETAMWDLGLGGSPALVAPGDRVRFVPVRQAGR